MRKSLLVAVVGIALAVPLSFTTSAGASSATCYWPGTGTIPSPPPLCPDNFPLPVWQSDCSVAVLTIDGQKHFIRICRPVPLQPWHTHPLIPA